MGRHRNQLHLEPLQWNLVHGNLPYHCDLYPENIGVGIGGAAACIGQGGIGAIPVASSC
ncbi:MAG: hypothetical protein GY724_23220 [Actinomycetia bacterium]|nr:hypothetical protein [Actinomycetes bacterium]MCP5031650.1 hypothetical protein [Actinomycetes bacterium]